MQYRTLYIPAELVDEILNDLAVIGWKLETNEQCKADDKLPIFGGENDVEHLSKIMISIDDSSPTYKDRITITDEYLKAKEKQTIFKRAGVGKIVTGIVFASLFTVGFVFGLWGAINANSVNSIAILISFYLFAVLPVYPLCIWGIIHRKKRIERVLKEVKDDIDEALEKANKL